MLPTGPLGSYADSALKSGGDELGGTAGRILSGHLNQALSTGLDAVRNTDYTGRKIVPDNTPAVEAGTTYALRGLEKAAPIPLGTIDPSKTTVPIDQQVIAALSGQRASGVSPAAAAFQREQALVKGNRDEAEQLARSRPEFARATPARQQQMIQEAVTALTNAAKTAAGVQPRGRALGLPPQFFGVPAGSVKEAQIAAALQAKPTERTAQQRSLVQLYKGLENPTYRDAVKQRSAADAKAAQDARQLVGAH
jgi:hypothetical protein